MAEEKKEFKQFSYEELGLLFILCTIVNFFAIYSNFSSNSTFLSFFNLRPFIIESITNMGFLILAVGLSFSLLFFYYYCVNRKDDIRTSASYSLFLILQWIASIGNPLNALNYLNTAFLNMVFCIFSDFAKWKVLPTSFLFSVIFSGVQISVIMVALKTFIVYPLDFVGVAIGFGVNLGYYISKFFKTLP